MSRYKYHLSRLRSDKYTLCSPVLASWGRGQLSPAGAGGVCHLPSYPALSLSPVNLLEQTIECVKPNATRLVSKQFDTTHSLWLWVSTSTLTAMPKSLFYQWGFVTQFLDVWAWRVTQWCVMCDRCGRGRGETPRCYYCCVAANLSLIELPGHEQHSAHRCNSIYNEKWSWTVQVLLRFIDSLPPDSLESQGGRWCGVWLYWY